jgi:DNA-binding CsgD family transcriptional regulator
MQSSLSANAKYLEKCEVAYKSPGKAGAYSHVLMSAKTSFRSTVRVKRMSLIAPPARNGVPANDPLKESSTQFELLGDVIANAGFGLILVTANQRIVWANKSAGNLMRKSSELRCKDGRISASDFKIAHRLRSLISATSQLLNEEASRGSILLRNEDGLASLVVHVVPLASLLTVLPHSERPVAGLILADCQSGSDARTGVFVDLFDLTSGEARVLAQLVSGKGLPIVARRLDISRSTARTHLERILQKTGTHRQAELVRVFFETTIPLEGYRSRQTNNA